ncbi:hypothetical protein OOK29_25965 [Streptomyces phaeochromogenes]|uniref:hypothetical protein n=1 Tax=Streptomyces phaeochromogenes TaxID=1923 RepID=UPI00225324F2|nr:hypothetical protein [Streptomyces phaeochromogenes]MCX5601601.1 hypothetical protein [Streptomyces phaeochromogenes]
MTARRPRPERTTLPGIADIRIVADEATTQLVLDVLQTHFTTTTPRPYSGGRSYLQLDTGNTAPDGDDQ